MTVHETKARPEVQRLEASLEVPGARGPETHIYKEADGLPIRADVWGAEPGGRKPAVLWIHGGALILGSRRSVPRAFRELAGSGYVRPQPRRS